MLIQSKQNYSAQRQNFGAKLVAKETVKKCLQQDIVNFYNTANPQARKRYFENETLNFENSWNGIVQTFEEKTKHIPGIVEFDFPKDKFYSASINYMVGKKEYTFQNAIYNGFLLLPDREFDKGVPYGKAIIDLAQKISGAIYKTEGKKFENNPFEKLCQSMASPKSSLEK